MRNSSAPLVICGAEKLFDLKDCDFNTSQLASFNAGGYRQWRATSQAFLDNPELQPDMSDPRAREVIEDATALYEDASILLRRLKETTIGYIGATMVSDIKLSTEHIHALVEYVLEDQVQGKTSEAQSLFLNEVSRYLSAINQAKEDATPLDANITSPREFAAFILAKSISKDPEKRLPLSPEAREELSKFFLSLPEETRPHVVIGGASTTNAAIFGALGGKSNIMVNDSGPADVTDHFAHLEPGTVTAHQGSRSFCITEYKPENSLPPHLAIFTEECLLPSTFNKDLLPQELAALAKGNKLDLLVTGNESISALDALDDEYRREFLGASDAFMVLGLHKESPSGILRSYDCLGQAIDNGKIGHLPFSAFRAGKEDELVWTLSQLKNFNGAVDISLTTQEARGIIAQLGEESVARLYEPLAAHERDRVARFGEQVLLQIDRAAVWLANNPSEKGAEEYPPLVAAMSRYLAGILQAPVRVRSRYLDAFTMPMSQKERLGGDDAIVKTQAISRTFTSGWFARRNDMPQHPDEFVCPPLMLNDRNVDAYLSAKGYLIGCDDVVHEPGVHSRFSFVSGFGFVTYAIPVPPAYDFEGGTVCAGDLTSTIQLAATHIQKRDGKRGRAEAVSA